MDPWAPLAWDLIVTMTASWQKIFSSNVKIGYWSLHSAAQAARDAGATTFQTAKTPAEIDAVIRNTAVQGTLSIIYAVLVLIVLAAALMVSVRAVRAGSLPTSEEPDVPSRIFAPAGFVATPAEKAVLQQWADAGLAPTPTGRAHG